MSTLFTLDTSTLDSGDWLWSGANAGGGFYPQVIVEIAFASGALDEPAVWTDVSHYVLSIQTSRGRQHELQRFEAGTATVVLSNRDGRFSPFNASSPYSPNVLPFKQLRVRAVWSGATSFTLFRGFIDAWPMKWSTVADSDVTLHCVDAFKILAFKRPGALYTTYPTTVLASTPYLYYRFNDAPGSTVIRDSSGNGRDATVFSQASSPNAFALGQAGAIVGDTDAALDFGTKGGTVHFDGANFDGTNFTAEAWINPRLTGNGTFFDISNAAGTKVAFAAVTATGVATLTAVDGVNSLTVTGVRQLTDGKWHHVIVSIGGAAGAIYVDGVLDASASSAPGAMSLTGITFVTFGGSGGPSTQAPAADMLIDEAAVYSVSITQAMIDHYKTAVQPLSQQVTGARISALLTATGWPASLQTIDAGTSSLQAVANDALANPALSHAQTVTDTEGGALFISADGKVTFRSRSYTSASAQAAIQLTLGDSGVLGTEEPYLVDSVDIQFDDLDLWNEAVVTPSGMAQQTASDSTSQTAYGKRSQSLSTLDYDGSVALGHAQWIVGTNKTPLQRVRSVSFTPRSDPTALFPAALGLDLLSRVAFKRRPMDGSSSTFSQTSLIEGVDHQITKGDWMTTWRLSPTAALNMFVLDTSLLDGTDLLGY